MRIFQVQIVVTDPEDRETEASIRQSFEDAMQFSLEVVGSVAEVVRDTEQEEAQHED